MSAKINLYSGLGSGTVEPTEGYVYVVTKVTFSNEGATAGQASVGAPGREQLVNKLVPLRGGAGWEGTLVLQHGERLVVAASPDIRSVVEGYFLVDVATFARAGSHDAIETKDSALAKLTYLTLVELKRIRTILEGQSGIGADRDQAADEIDHELES